MINAFYDRVENDELLSPFFPGGVHEEHRRNVATWWSEVFGGPAAYTEEVGGYERMLNKHLQLGITHEQRFRFASLMSLAADDAGMPNDPEFRSALVAYLEWGTRSRVRELATRRGRRRARAGTPMGLGRSSAIPAVTPVSMPSSL